MKTDTGMQVEDMKVNQRIKDKELGKERYEDREYMKDKVVQLFTKNTALCRNEKLKYKV